MPGEAVDLALDVFVARLKPLSHCEHGTPFSEDCAQCAGEHKTLSELMFPLLQSPKRKATRDAAEALAEDCPECGACFRLLRAYRAAVEAEKGVKK